MLLLNCSGILPSAITREAANGVLDLRRWDFSSDPILNLNGEYAFYWHQFVAPGEIDSGTTAPEFVSVPDDWNSRDNSTDVVDGRGFATYRLRILLPPDPPDLSLKCYDISNAYRLFVNGKELLAIGEPGISPETSVPRYQPEIVALPSGETQLDLVFHVSNFHHRRGGIWEVLQMGTTGQLAAMQEKQHFWDFFLLGSIFIMALYHCGLFALRREARSLMFFGIFCFLISIRLLSTEEIYVVRLLPNLSWSNVVRLEYLSLYFAVPAFARFLRSLFQQEFHRYFMMFCDIFVGICVIIVLFFPVYYFSYTSPLYQLFMFFALLYGFLVLVRSTLHRREGALAMLFGYSIIFVSVINDMLNVNNVLHNGESVAVGLFFFILLQSFLLAGRYSRALKMVEKQREALTLSNQRYINELHEKQKTLEEKRILQEKLTRSQKLEALGVLASTVAHDLNNILSAMVIYPEIVRLRVGKDADTRTALSRIKEAGLRASAIIQDLLTLARRSVMTLKPLNLNDVVTDYIGSPEHQVFKKERPDIDCSFLREKKLVNILGSEIHLKKTLMNLIRNAAEAQENGGAIRITTHNLHADSSAAKHLKIPEGQYAVLRIRDEGVGISAKDLPHIFEPFYSTKNLGKSGTGLGMSVVWGTMQDHHGFVKVESSPNKGSTFSLFFPATGEQPETVQNWISEPFEFYRGNGETILIVDDLPEQRQMAQVIIEQLGYRPLIAENGDIALKQIADNNVDLVLLDLVLSNSESGLAVFRKIQQRTPEVKIIMLTGSSDAKSVTDMEISGVQRFVFKPYTVEKLGAAIREELYPDAGNVTPGTE